MTTHAYFACVWCGEQIAEFHRDGVWRDQHGHITCDHRRPEPGSVFHEPPRPGP